MEWRTGYIEEGDKIKTIVYTKEYDETYRNQMKENLNRLKGHSSCIKIDLTKTGNNTRTYLATFADGISVEFTEPFARPDKYNDMQFVLAAYLWKLKEYKLKCLNKDRWNDIAEIIFEYAKSECISKEEFTQMVLEEIEYQQNS